MQQLEQDSNTSMKVLEDSVVDGSLCLGRESGEEGPVHASDQALVLEDLFQDQEDINHTALKGSEEPIQEEDKSGLDETAPQGMMHSFGEDDDLGAPSTPISAVHTIVSIASSKSLLDELKASTGSRLDEIMPTTTVFASSQMRTSTPQLQHPSSYSFSSTASHVIPSRIPRADLRGVSSGSLTIGLGLAFAATGEKDLRETSIVHALRGFGMQVSRLGVIAGFV
ncbi:hypothetical protein BC830DRAFT_1102363 [Chytriomyces sp. MP71]|nr:hypothetical protein BC830DRAFT_1102363 [Chytriomyces sp. MP71]